MTQHEDELALLQSTSFANAQQYEENISKLKLDHAGEIDKERKVGKEALNVMEEKNANKIKENIANSTKSLNDLKESMTFQQKKYDEKVSFLEERHSARVKDLEGIISKLQVDFSEQITNERNENDKKINDLNTKVMEKHKENLNHQEVLKSQHLIEITGKNH